MKKSGRVTLTILAGIGCGAHAQQSSNPCLPGSFNAAACKTAVKFHGYCDGATFVPQNFQKYPYYYGASQAYASGGGVVMAAPAGTCRAIGHGGFGAHGAAAQAHGGS
jgi:hypothetical protein